MSRPTTATIHHAALRHNLQHIRKAAAGANVMAVVKADAYGHGLERVAGVLRDADAFGVAALGDLERLRAIGLGNRVLILSGFDEPADLPKLRDLAGDTAVHHEFQLEILEAAAPQWNGAQALDVWLKVDSGMHRLGFAPDKVAGAYARLQRLQQQGVVGEIRAINHFASSDEFENPKTLQQLQAFDAATHGMSIERTTANSAAIFGFPQTHRNWVRAGGALYGQTVVEGKCGADFGLRPAMTLHTRLIAVNSIQQGETVGYSERFRCPENMLVGVAAVGYADGYPRIVEEGTPVLVNGQRTQIIGRVSMDLMTIDLRNIQGAEVGASVTLWGGDLPVEEVARHAGTIGYDLTCSITRRVLFTDA